MYCKAKSVNRCHCCQQGVRVSSGHLCEAEAPTEAAAETSFSYPHCAADFFWDNNTTKVVNSSNRPLAVPDSALTCSVVQSSTAALRFARCFSHCERSQPHLLLSYINSPLISNRDVIICNLRRNIPHRFTFETKYDIIN